MVLGALVPSTGCNPSAPSLRPCSDFSLLCRPVFALILRCPRPYAPVMTSLHDACRRGRVDDVLSRLDRGEDINGTVCSWGHRPLHIACMCGHADVVRLLLDRGADVNAFGGIFDYTPLQIASWHGHVDAARLLLDRGAVRPENP